MAREDRDIDAAERALGTLPIGRERGRDLERREAWEIRLAGLTAVIPPATPPEGLFRVVEARIERDAAVIDLEGERARRRRWQRIALTFGASAAVALLLVIAPLVDPPPAYVAVVYADDDPNRAGMVIQIDAVTGTATVVPTGVGRLEDASFEMWHLPEGASRPYSLGLLPEAPHVLGVIDAGVDVGDVFAISREPPGGSPSGQPTEPMFHGTVERTED